MKRTFNIFSLICLLAILVMSCKEDEKSNTPFTNGTATLTGIAYLNYDYRNDTDEYGNSEVQYELARQGTILYAEADADDLVSYPSNGVGVGYGTITYSTLVQADGSYSFTIDANEKPVIVSLHSDDYREDFIYSDEYSESGIVTLSLSQDTLVKDITKIMDVYFN